MKIQWKDCCFFFHSWEWLDYHLLLHYLYSIPGISPTRLAVTWYIFFIFSHQYLGRMKYIWFICYLSCKIILKQGKPKCVHLILNVTGYLSNISVYTAQDCHKWILLRPLLSVVEICLRMRKNWLIEEFNFAGFLFKSIIVFLCLCLWMPIRTWSEFQWLPVALSWYFMHFNRYFNRSNEKV